MIYKEDIGCGAGFAQDSADYDSAFPNKTISYRLCQPIVEPRSASRRPGSFNPTPRTRPKADSQSQSVTSEMKLPRPLKAIILKKLCGAKCGVKSEKDKK